MNQNRTTCSVQAVRGSAIGSGPNSGITSLLRCLLPLAMQKRVIPRCDIIVAVAVPRRNGNINRTRASLDQTRRAVTDNGLITTTT